MTAARGTTPSPRTRWRPTRVQAVAGAAVVAGFTLLSASWWFLLLVAAGSFGPGLLREIGWLQDQDEFERRAAHRAGYHAFLVAGIVASALVALVRSHDGELRNAGEIATLFFALLWFVWLFSSLLGFWGATKTATRLLFGYGTAWLAFTILSNVGSEWTGWTALLLHPLLTVPFFALAWLAPRAPKSAGGLLVAAAVFFTVFFDLFGVRRGSSDGPGPIDQAITFLLFVGPLLASGGALLVARTTAEHDGDDELLSPDDDVLTDENRR